MAQQNFGLIRESTSKAVLQAIPVPTLRDDYILVRTVAVALNPTDWTTLDAPGAEGTLVGCDYAGVVEAVGPAVTRSFKQGDRVCGFAHGANDANPENGAFARFIAVKGDLQTRIPDGVSFEAAATVGVGITTVGYALYEVLKLPLPETLRENTAVGELDPVLIYGGSTATGSLAIQLAILSGRRVITTCSPKHFDLAKSRGADVVYDYRTPKVGEKIRHDTQGKLRDVFDTVSLPQTAKICAAAIGATGGKYCNLLGTAFPREDVESTFFLGYSVSGEEYIFENETYPAQPEFFEFGRKWSKLAERLWAEGKWVVHPHRVCGGGVAGVIEGMKEGREGKISGEKLVYRVEDTDWPL